MKARPFILSLLTLLLFALLTACGGENDPNTALTEFPENENMLAKAWCMSIDTEDPSEDTRYGRILLNHIDETVLDFYLVLNGSSRTNSYQGRRIMGNEISYQLYTEYNTDTPLTDITMMTKDYLKASFQDDDGNQVIMELFVTDNCQKPA